MHHYDNWEITIRGDEMIMSAYMGIDNVHFEVKAVENNSVPASSLVTYLLRSQQLSLRT